MGQNGQVRRFRGSFVLKIDDRGRIKLPSKYISILENYGNEMYLTSINGDNILIYPLTVWEDIENKIGKLKIRNQIVEDFVRRISYWGSEIELDPRGRLLIPGDLRQKSNLNKEVLILGEIDHMVLWNNEDFKERFISKKFTSRQIDEVSRLLNEFSTLPGNE